MPWSKFYLCVPAAAAAAQTSDGSLSDSAEIKSGDSQDERNHQRIPLHWNRDTISQRLFKLLTFIMYPVTRRSLKPLK